MRMFFLLMSYSFSLSLSSPRTLLKPRPERRRLLLLLLVSNFACYIFAYNGTEGSHRYLFAGRKYGWEEGEYTIFLSVYRVFYLVTLWLLVPFCSRYLGLHDATVAIIGGWRRTCLNMKLWTGQERAK